jgi:carbamoyltransferase
MKILGITDGISSGAAIVEDGLILAAVNEERLSRKKMAIGFPRASIRMVLELARVQPSDLDGVAVATEDCHFYDDVTAWDGWFEAKRGPIRQLLQDLASEYSPLTHRLPGLREVYYRTRTPFFAQRRRRIADILGREFGIACTPRFVNHHFAHAASAYVASGYRDALVTTMDGGGDQSSSQVYYVKDGVFSKLHETSSFDSLGNYYMYATHLCGFKAQKHEGKITGLAAFGDPVYLPTLQRFMSYEHGKMQNHAGVVFRGAVEALRRALPPGFEPRDLAASIQQHLELNASAYVSRWLQETRCGHLALAGGVFANVRLNQRIHQLEDVEEMFVFPAMSDEGLAVGAAFAMLADCPGRHGSFPSPGLRDVYLGPRYTNDDIELALRRSGLPYEFVTDIEQRVVEKLVAGLVVARFDGGMEYGPRALGNRSILYHPSDRSVNTWLNQKLRRTEFMPFAPSTLVEHAHRCFVGVTGAEEAARYMTTTFDCTEWMKRHAPGVVHVDGTARPQLVSRAHNPGFYRVIEAFWRRTGLPAIINTSFNIHEEPIVCSPEDAIRGFLEAQLDYLAVGNFIVRHPRPPQRELVPASRV